MNFFIRLIIVNALLLVFASCTAGRRDRECLYMIYTEYCEKIPRSIRKTVSASVPTQTASTSHNPSSVSTEKGLGVEALMYDGFGFGVVTGNGRIGAAISSSSPENTFFGNHAFEVPEDRVTRTVEQDQYDGDKLALSTAVNVFSVKSKDVPIKFNLGLTLKRQSEIKRVNWGSGASLMLGPLSFGYSFYYDDQYWNEPQPVLYYHDNDSLNWVFFNEPRTEKFTVSTINVGVKYDFFAGDYVYMKTDFPDSPQTVSEVKIYNATFIFSGSMLTIGRRSVLTNRSYYDYTNAEYMQPTEEWDTLIAYQYSINKNWLLGLMHNYHLHNGLTFIFTYFL